MDPERVTLFLLIKVALRNEVLKPGASKIAVKKKAKLEEVAEPIIEAPVVEEKVLEEVRGEEKTIEQRVAEINSEPVEPQVEASERPAEVVAEEVDTTGNFEKTWEGFLAYFVTQHMSIAVNLERGNILGGLELTGKLSLEIGYGVDSRIFFDLVNENVAKGIIKEELARFFGKKIEDVELKYTVLDEADQEEKQFQSKAEIDEKIREEKIAERREKIANNKYIKDAEKLFNSKVDRIVLNKEEN